MFCYYIAKYSCFSIWCHLYASPFLHERLATVTSSNCHQNTGEIRPRDVSQTVSVGESVTFVVVKDSELSEPLQWRHNGSSPKPGLMDQTQYTIPTVTLDDAGIYECHQNHARGTGKHAIFQLVVRGDYYTLVHIFFKGRFNT